MKKKILPYIIAILTFVILSLGYEYYVYLWSKDEIGAVIRVDVILIYPIIIGLSILAFRISKKKIKKV